MKRYQSKPIPIKVCENFEKLEEFIKQNGIITAFDQESLWISSYDYEKTMIKYPFAVIFDKDKQLFFYSRDKFEELFEELET